MQRVLPLIGVRMCALCAGLLLRGTHTRLLSGMPALRLSGFAAAFADAAFDAWVAKFGSVKFSLFVAPPEELLRGRARCTAHCDL